jgi:hypothetical protein
MDGTERPTRQARVAPGLEGGGAPVTYGIVYYCVQLCTNYKFCSQGPRNPVRSIHDSVFWDECITQDDVMGDGTQNIALAYSTDGVNPFRSGQYSMWPLTFKVRSTQFYTL